MNKSLLHFSQGLTLSFIVVLGTVIPTPAQTKLPTVKCGKWKLGIDTISAFGEAELMRQHFTGGAGEHFIRAGKSPNGMFFVIMDIMLYEDEEGGDRLGYRQSHSL
jgi:hypothetical protein